VKVHVSKMHATKRDKNEALYSNCGTTETKEPQPGLW